MIWHISKLDFEYCDILHSLFLFLLSSSSLLLVLFRCTREALTPKVGTATIVGFHNHRRHRLHLQLHHLRPEFSDVWHEVFGSMPIWIDQDVSPMEDNKFKVINHRRSYARIRANGLINDFVFLPISQWKSPVYGCSRFSIPSTLNLTAEIIC